YLVEISEPFTADGRLKIVKTRNLLRDEAGWGRTRLRRDRIPHRDGARSIQCCRYNPICGSKDHIRRKAYDFLRHVAHALLAFACKAVVETDVAAVCPAEVLQRFSDVCEIPLPSLVILREAHNDADTSYSIALLGARGERPDGRTAKYGNEDAS